MDIKMCVLSFVICVIRSGDLYFLNYDRNLLILNLYGVDFIILRLKYVVSLWILILVSFIMVDEMKLFFGL